MRRVTTSSVCANNTSVRRLEQPDEEPVDIAMVRKVLRFVSSTEDPLLAGWITAARQYFEDQTSRCGIASLWEYAMDAAPAGWVIELPRPPLLTVEAVLYDDGDGVEQTLDVASYRVLGAGVGSPPVVLDPFAARGRLELVDGASWPTLVDQIGALRIQFTAGYGSTFEEIPEIVKSVHYDLVRHFHRRSNEDLPMTTQTMLRMFRQSAIATIPPERSAWL